VQKGPHQIGNLIKNIYKLGFLWVAAINEGLCAVTHRSGKLRPDKEADKSLWGAWQQQNEQTARPRAIEINKAQ